MVNVLIIEAYESYRDNLVEYFELKGCKVYAIDQCSKLFSLFPEILFDIIICDFDQEMMLGLKDFKRFINLEFAKSSFILLLTVKTKKLSEIYELEIYHDQMYLVEGKRLNDISLLMKKLGI